MLVWNICLTRIKHIVGANEGGAVALALGISSGDTKDSSRLFAELGIRQHHQSLLSLADKEVYSDPHAACHWLAGEPGVHDEPQHKKQGRVMLPMLKAMEIPYSILGPEVDNGDAMWQMHWHMFEKPARPLPSSLRRKPSKLSRLRGLNPGISLSREEAIKQVLEVMDKSDMVVATTGMPSREVYECRAKKGEGHQRDFLTVGGMGHASQIALGIALQKPERSIYCLDGDGALLMHMGALAINGTFKAKNLKHIILNNGAHDSVGGQPTVGLSIDLLSVAHAVGYQYAARTQTRQELHSSLRILKDSIGPSLLEIRVRRGARKDLGRPATTPAQNKNVFMDFVG